MCRNVNLSQGYLRWIVNSFQSCSKEWGWVDSARSLLGGSSSSILNDDSIVGDEIGVDQQLHWLEPSTSAYSSLLRSCGEARALQSGKRVHTHMVRNGYARDSFMENMLVQMYGKCGRIDLSTKIFDAMSNRDKFSWNIMITANARNGHYREALAVFERMEASGAQPDAFILASILGVYARCKSIGEARQVFDRIHTADRASWTAMITAYAHCGYTTEALLLFRKMDLEGITKNEMAFVSVLGACTSSGLVEEGRNLYSRYRAHGFKPSLVMDTTILNLCARSGGLEDAWRVFKKMQVQDVAAYTSMMEACTRHGQGERAVVLYRTMNLEGMRPDLVSLVAALTACSFTGNLAEGKSVHSRISQEFGGVENVNEIVATALLNMYGKNGCLEEAREVFEGICRNRKDVVAWNAMLAAYVQYERFEQALELYHRMQAELVTPDVITFSTMVCIFAREEALVEARKLHRDLSSRAVRQDLESHIALLNMYAKCGSLEEAVSVFERMPKWDIVAWNAMLAWYVRFGLAREALELYQVLESAQVLHPDAVTYVGVFTACSLTGSLVQGMNAHLRMQEAGLTPDVVMETSLLNMYSKCGGVEAARSVFEDMVVRNAVTFNCMVAAYAQHGHMDEVNELVWRMSQEGLFPDVITLICVLVSCSNAGLYFEGLNYFMAMRGDHDISIVAEHYQCLVGLLSKAGRLHEAESVLELMPLEPNAVGWKSLLAGCVLHSDPQRGARAVDRACKLDPSDSSQYVQLRNMFVEHCNMSIAT